MAGPRKIPLDYDLAPALRRIRELDSRLTQVARSFGQSLEREIAAATQKATQGGGQQGAAGAAPGPSTSGGAPDPSRQSALGRGADGPSLASSLGGIAGAAFGGLARAGENAFNRSTGQSAAETSARALVAAPFEAAAGVASLIPGAGGVAAAAIRQQQRLKEEEIFRPFEATNARLGGIAGTLAAAGVDVSDADIQQGAKVVREQERRRLAAERRTSRIVWSTGAMLDALSSSFFPGNGG